MRRAPPSALAICRRLALIRPSCPRLVPIGPYAAAKRPPGYRGVAAGGAIALCGDERLRGVSITNSTCRYQTWSLEVGAPAGLPPDALPGIPGKRLGSDRARPPQYVHIVIYAARGPLEQKLFPFAWPHDQAHAIKDSLLRPKRRQPISLGSVRWAGLDGQRVLAPPLLFGGEVGDHLIFHWKAAGIEHAVSFIPGPHSVRRLPHSRLWWLRRVSERADFEDPKLWRIAARARQLPPQPGKSLGKSSARAGRPLDEERARVRAVWKLPGLDSNQQPSG
jgi:hypothetical protein